MITGSGLILYLLIGSVVSYLILYSFFSTGATGGLTAEQDAIYHAMKSSELTRTKVYVLFVVLWLPMIIYGVYLYFTKAAD